MNEQPIGICLLGRGIVGSGVLRILTEQRDLVRRRTGLHFDVRHVVVRDLKKISAHRTQHASLPLTTDAASAIDDPAVQIVIELIGGTTAAGQYIERALKLGKHVITANKSLLAQRGAELFALARKHKACIAFEASAGGGIPIIDALSRGLIANRIDALMGIVNGTCNTILTRMTRNGWSYPQALAEAQKLGFAEADPTLDVSGRDAAQKLALLASLAFNVRVQEQDVTCEGIDTLQPADITFAGNLGYVIKLLAIAERVHGDCGLRIADCGLNEGSGAPGTSAREHKGAKGAASLSANPQSAIALRVHPTLVHKDDVLAEVSGGFNAISVYGHALGHALFYGRGAGQMPTASAVVADLIGVALGVTPLMFERLSIYPDSAGPARVLPPEQVRSRYYLRLTVKDQPGVMGQVSQILGAHGISLSAIMQPETGEEPAADRPATELPTVAIVITTHMAQEGPMRQSLKAIDALACIVAPTVCLRIIDQPKEFAQG